MNLATRLPISVESTDPFAPENLRSPSALLVFRFGDRVDDPRSRRLWPDQIPSTSKRKVTNPATRALHPQNRKRFNFHQRYKPEANHSRSETATRSTRPAHSRSHMPGSSNPERTWADVRN